MPSEREHRTSPRSPFLMSFAQERIGSSELPGRYCTDRDVWVVNTAEGLVSLIQSREECRAGETVTRVLAEQTDQSIGGVYAGTVAGMTSTAVEMERTDTRTDAMPLHLAVTLTEVRAEQTDA